MSTETVTVAQARNDFSNLLAQTELLDRRFVIARRGKPKAALVSVKDLARLEALEQAAGSATSERDQAIQVLQQAGLLRPVSPELVKRYVYLTPEQRAKVREELAELRFDPPLSEQIIEDRGEK
jgi:prevent-host-death family protein